MMAGTSQDCPHCGTKNSFFKFEAEIPSQINRGLWHILSTCASCKDAVVLTFLDVKGGGLQPISIADASNISEMFRLIRIVPEQSEPQIAEAIPENVEKPLLEAEQAFASGLYSAAGSCYRKAVERALKAIDPQLEGMLNARIRKLEKKGLLPHAMIELLDQVRLFGNASMHEDDEDPTKEECTSAREFCHLFLTYAFTLPAKINLAKGQSENQS